MFITEEELLVCFATRFAGKYRRPGKSSRIISDTLPLSARMRSNRMRRCPRDWQRVRRGLKSLRPATLENPVENRLFAVRTDIRATLTAVWYICGPSAQYTCFRFAVHKNRLFIKMIKFITVFMQYTKCVNWFFRFSNRCSILFVHE